MWGGKIYITYAYAGKEGIRKNVGQNVIELNGKRYDAITGVYLGKSHVVPAHIMAGHAHGKVIDGIVRPGQHTTPSRPKPAPAAAHTEAKTKPTPHQAAKQTHAKAPHLKAHHPQRAQTLMHRSGKKPEFSLKPAIKTQSPAEVMARPVSALVHKRSAYSIDPVRKERAGQVNKHQAVRHFHPAHRPESIHAVSAEVPVIAVHQAPASLITEVRPKHHDIFERAIARATSHQQPAHKVKSRRSRRRRLANSLAIVAAFLVIGGFVTYLNMPQLKLRVASFQAGFGASIPTYVPTGYALNDIKRNGGTISLSFRSGESQFSITQQSSDWNSQTLLDNTLSLNGRHQTVQKNGQTIYVYDNSTKASWVNGGVRYDISGNAELNSRDVIDIATSL